MKIKHLPRAAADHYSLLADIQDILDRANSLVLIPKGENKKDFPLNDTH